MKVVTRGILQRMSTDHMFCPSHMKNDVEDGGFISDLGFSLLYLSCRIFNWLKQNFADISKIFECTGVVCGLYCIQRCYFMLLIGM